MRTLSTFALTALVSTSAWAQEFEQPLYMAEEVEAASETIVPTIHFNENYLSTQGMLETLKKSKEQKLQTLYETGFMFNSEETADSDKVSPTIENYIALKKGLPLPYSMLSMGEEYPDIKEAVEALNNPKTTSNYLKVGVFLPISSPLKNVSKSILSAVQTALFELENNNVLIYVYDIGNSDNQAFKAINLAKQDGIQVALGPIRADQANFVKSALRNIPVISFTNTESILRKGLYSISYLPHDQVSALSDHALATDKTKVSSFMSNSDATQNSLSDTVIRHIQSSTYNQAYIHPTWSYDPSTNNNKSDIQQLIDHNSLLTTQETLVESLSNTEVLTEEENKLFQELQNDNLSSLIPFESLFLPSTPKEAKTLSHQLAFYDIDARRTQILGLYPLANLSGRKDFPSSLSGAILPTPDQAAIKEFKETFNEATGKKAKNLDVLAYDAIQILNEVALISNGRFNEDVFERPSGFWGYGGAIRFLDNGKNIRKYGISKLSKRKLIPITQVTGLATHKHYESVKTNPFFSGSGWGSDNGWTGSTQQRPQKPKKEKKEDFYIEWF